MKSVIAVAAFAAVAAADTVNYWGDVPVDPTTTTSSVDPTWSDVPVKETTTSSYDPTWSDVPVKETTTSSYDPTWKDVKETSTTKSYDPTWKDEPVKETSTTTAAHTWSDYVDPSSTATWADLPVDPTSTNTWADLPVAPTDGGHCKVVTVTKTGTAYVWVPVADATTAVTWSDAPVAPTTTKKADPTWSDADPTWSDVPVDPTSTTTASYVWSDVPAGTSTTASTTKKPVWTTSTTAAAKPTTTSAANTNCGATFNVKTNVAVGDTSGAKFWSLNPTQQTTNAECQALCDANALCEATLWVGDDSYKNNAQDYKICYQTSGLKQPTGSGPATVSYKNKDGTAKCSASYNTFGGK